MEYRGKRKKSNVYEDDLNSLVTAAILESNEKNSSNSFSKKNGGNNLNDFITIHSQKHIYDPPRVSTKNRSQFGQNTNVKALTEDTIRSPDSISTSTNITKYAKSYNFNISTPDTPTGEMRVFINHDKPDRSTQLPYVSRK